MQDNKIICKKENFIDEVFGENIEYARIYDDKETTIIFGVDNQVIIKRFKNMKDVIEKFIEKYNECEFLNQILDEQELEIENLQRENIRLNNQLKTYMNS